MDHPWKKTHSSVKAQPLGLADMNVKTAIALLHEGSLGFWTSTVRSITDSFRKPLQVSQIVHC